jgi:hypothetical protein
MGGAFCMCRGEERCVQGFGGKPEVRRLLGKLKLRKNDSI